MPFDLDLTDPTLTPAERERRRALVAEHQRQVARLEEQRKLDDQLRRVFLGAKPNASDEEFQRALPGLRKMAEEAQVQASIEKLVAERDDDPDGLTSPDLWGLRRR